MLVPFGKARHHGFQPRRRKRKVGGMGLGAHELPPGVAAVPLAGGQLLTCHLWPWRVAGISPWWQAGHDDTTCATHRCPTRSLPRGLHAVDDMDHLHSAASLCASQPCTLSGNVPELLQGHLHGGLHLPASALQGCSVWARTAGTMVIMEQRCQGCEDGDMAVPGDTTVLGDKAVPGPRWQHSAPPRPFATRTPTQPPCVSPAAMGNRSHYSSWGCCTSGSWRIWTLGMAVRS